MLKCDTNKDNQLTLDELKLCWPYSDDGSVNSTQMQIRWANSMNKTFIAADANKDGYLTVEEFRSFDAPRAKVTSLLPPTSKKPRRLNEAPKSHWMSEESKLYQEESNKVREMQIEKKRLKMQGGA